jgi:NAD(P)-dependent dehydrogenase (short-subunit alcohol dehydrogenase family)
VWPWPIDGFSEVLAKEMALIGVQVTVIEPGGFRTDFAGSSTLLHAGRPEGRTPATALSMFRWSVLRVRIS